MNYVGKTHEIIWARTKRG